MLNKIRNYSEEPISANWDILCETDKFKEFLKKVFKYADTICFTYSKQYENFLKSEWSFLEDSIENYKSTNETFVTKGPYVTLIYLKIDKTTKEWLLGKSGIDSFLRRDYRKSVMEDLCFARNGEIVFTSCTHERFCDMNRDLAAYLEKNLSFRFVSNS